MSDLIKLREKMLADPGDEDVAVGIAKLAFRDPSERQIARVKSALGGSMDAALRLVERTLPNRVIQIVLSRQVYPSAAISPAPPFPENPPMYQGSAMTGGEAILCAMLEALISESNGSRPGGRSQGQSEPVDNEPEHSTAQSPAPSAKIAEKKA